MEDMTPGGSGVRAQAVAPDGALVDDFRFVGARAIFACAQCAFSGGHGFVAHWARDIEDGAGGDYGLACERLTSAATKSHVAKATRETSGREASVSLPPSQTRQGVSADFLFYGRIHMAQSLSSKKKVAVLGAGKMGSILLQSFLRDGLLSPGQTWATVAHPERARMLKEKLKVHAGTDNCRGGEERGHYFSLREAAGGGGRGAGDPRALEWEAVGDFGGGVGSHGDD